MLKHVRLRRKNGLSYSGHTPEQRRSFKEVGETSRNREKSPTFGGELEMIVYIICYLSVGILLYNFEKQKNQKFVVFICIMILSLLAGFRDVSIGTDVRIYANNVYSAASKVTNVNELRDFLFQSPLHTINEIESAYMFVVFIGAKLFKSLFGPLFLTSLIINTGVFVGLFRIREHLSYNIAIMVYCFMFYQQSYNMMRQWMAMAIIIYGIKYIYDRKLIKYIITVLVAMLFHRSAFIGISLYFLALYMEKPRNLLRQTVVITGTVLGVVFFQSIVAALTSSGMLTAKYLKYSLGGTVSLFWQELVIRIPPIALCTVLYKPMKKADIHHAFWFIIMLIEAAISQLHSIMDLATRIGAYFWVSQIIELSMACKVGIRNQKILVKSLVASYVILYWFVMYIYFGYSDTYPYVFM